ncbi:hypothetical protein EVAR_65678_1 [Eumeta japonica]|uniref:Uncharacterized protein n=1 Tax=Eumeta variegata TaxID=151549 RepID=A0A4C1ZLR3_EUMVA|nr:hypothetical protein EVAR_65678_1 [Eumeta japonica]
MCTSTDILPRFNSFGAKYTPPWNDTKPCPWRRGSQPSYFKALVCCQLSRQILRSWFQNNALRMVELCVQSQNKAVDLFFIDAPGGTGLPTTRSYIENWRTHNSLSKHKSTTTFQRNQTLSQENDEQCYRDNNFDWKIQRGFENGLDSQLNLIDDAVVGMSNCWTEWDEIFYVYFNGYLDQNTIGPAEISCVNRKHGGSLGRAEKIRADPTVSLERFTVT